MASRVEDLEVWHIAMDIATRVYEVTRIAPLSRDYSLSDQLRRSAVSIAANIAEGFGRFGNREFGRFVLIARGSCFEVVTLLELSCRTGLCATSDAEDVIMLIKIEIGKLTSLRNRLVPK